MKQCFSIAGTTSPLEPAIGICKRHEACAEMCVPCNGPTRERKIVTARGRGGGSVCNDTPPAVEVARTKTNRHEAYVFRCYLVQKEAFPSSISTNSVHT